MNTLNPELGQRIADLFNEIECSKIMYEAKNKEAFEVAGTGDPKRSADLHERWVYWWNEGRRAAIELNEMGVPVLIPKEVS